MTDKKTNTHTYKMYYFDGRGAAEVSRLLFAQAGVSFEDARQKDWPARKGEMPYGQMPVLELDGEKFAESHAIERYLARSFNLYGSGSPIDAFRIDMVCEGLIDISTGYGNIRYRAKDEEKKDKFAAFFKDDVSKWLGFLTTALKKNNGGKGFFVGDAVSLADIHTYNQLWSLTQHEGQSAILDNFAELKALVARVGALPNIAKWVASRPPSQF